jgi:hypothetical protein
MLTYNTGLLVGALMTVLIAFTFVGLLHDFVAMSAWVALAVAISVVALLGDGGVIPRMLPSAQRLVPEVVGQRGLGGVFQFGLEMGTGARTYSTTQLPHIVLAWAVLFAHSWAVVLIVAVGFAAGRGVPFVVVNWAFDDRQTQDFIERILGGLLARLLCIVGIAGAVAMEAM